MIQHRHVPCRERGSVAAGGAGDLERVNDGLHREASRGDGGNCQVGFFSRATATASLSTSTSNVPMPRSLFSSRPLRQIAGAAGGCDIVVGFDCGRSALGRQLPPFQEQAL